MSVEPTQFPSNRHPKEKDTHFSFNNGENSKSTSHRELGSNHKKIRREVGRKDKMSSHEERSFRKEMGVAGKAEDEGMDQKSEEEGQGPLRRNDTEPLAQKWRWKMRVQKRALVGSR